MAAHQVRQEAGGCQIDDEAGMDEGWISCREEFYSHDCARERGIGGASEDGHEAQPGTGILYLDLRWYSDDFGINYGGTEEMEFQSV